MARIAIVKTLLATAVLLALSPAVLGAQGTDPAGSLIDLNGTQIFVRRVGQGAPIYVIHGGPMLDHGYLVGPLKDLGTRFELVFADQRLNGRSSAETPTENLTLATLTEDIEALRRRLGHDRIHLMAHSWGGLLALNYAIDHGDHLASLVLVSPMPPSAELFRTEQRQLAQQVSTADSELQRQLRDTEAFKNRQPQAILAMLLLSFRTSMADPADIELLGLYVPADYAERSQRFASLGPELQTFDLVGQLDRIIAPTLILYGQSEPAAELSGSVLSEGIPDSTLEIFEDCGHFAFIEQPAAFDDAVGAFYDRLAR